MDISTVFRVTQYCPYRTDWTTRAVIPIARLLEFPILHAKRKVVWGAPRSATVGFVVFFLVVVVGLIAAQKKDILLPNAGSQIPPSEYAAILNYVILLFPAAMAAFGFYRRLYPVFDTLRQENILKGSPIDYAAFKGGLDDLLNDTRYQIIPIALTLFWAFGGLIHMLNDYNLWVPSGLTHILSADKPVWGDELDLPIKIWLLVSSSCIVFTLIYVWWKGLVIWWTIRKLSIDGYGLKLEPQDGHPDMSGGLSVLSNLWLRMHYLILFTGTWIFGWAIIMADWNVSVVVGLALFVVVAPCLFLGPFLTLHSSMVSHRREKIESVAGVLKLAEENVIRKTKMPESLDEDTATLIAVAEYHRKSMQDAVNLPTWPFNARTWGRFLASYFVPFTILTIDLLARFAFGR